MGYYIENVNVFSIRQCNLKRLLILLKNIL